MQLAFAGSPTLCGVLPKRRIRIYEHYFRKERTFFESKIFSEWNGACLDGFDCHSCWRRF